MKRKCLPVLFVIALLVTTSAICNSSSGSNYTGAGQPREVRWAMVEGELTSHALIRWEEAFPTCHIVKHAATVGGVSKSLVIFYTCDADKRE